MAGNMVITVDDAELKAAFKRAPGVVISKLSTWVETTAALAERTAKDKLRHEVSMGTSGRTLNSIKVIDGFNKLSKTVRPTVKYAYWVHEGRLPGKMPPWSEGTDLNAWAKRMGMNPFLVARSIARKGTKGHPFMQETYDDLRPEAERTMNTTLDEIVKGI